MNREEETLMNLASPLVETFKFKFPKLKSLVLENGIASIRFAQLFNPLKELNFGCLQTPNSHDLFTEEEIKVVEKINFGKMSFAADKLVRLFRIFS